MSRDRSPGPRPSSLLRFALPLLAASLIAAAPPPDDHAEPWDGPAFAADPAALLQAAAAPPGATGEDVVLLFEEARYSYDEAGRETFSQRLVYRIESANADPSWSTVDERWAPWHQERPELRARVIAPDGTVHLLDPATVAESAEAQDDPDMFEDGRVLRAPLPATGPGAVVEQEVTIRDTAPLFDGGTVSYATLALGFPVRHARLVLEAPVALPLRYVSRLLPAAKPREEVADGRRRLVFEYHDLAAAEDPEPGLPPDVPRSPYVAFSTGRSWADLARRYSAVVDDKVRGADLKAFVRAAGAPAGSQLETVERLLARLGEQVRYTGVELGEGGLVPRPPAETLRRKFGDCKDKAVALVALLRSVDIPAYVALLDAGEDDQDVEAELPGLGAFNHAIVVVPGTPPIWIDPTDRFARAGELPAQDQGRLALVASPTATGLVRTPESSAADNRESETREYVLADLGKARVIETTEYRGEPERDMRAFYATADPTEMRGNLQDYVKTAYLAKGIGSLDHSDPADLAHPFRLRLEAKESGRGVTAEGDAAVAVFPDALLSRLPAELTGSGHDKGGKKEAAQEGEKGAPRKGDYYFTHPLTVETHYRVVPPAGYAPQPLPASRTRQLGPATLVEAYAVAPDGAVTADLRFEVGKRRLTGAEFAALAAGVREVAAAKPVLLLFEQVGEAHLAAGRVREALAEFERLAGAAPKKALPRTRVARALLAGGMGDAAREAARRAVQLEPGSALAHRTLGWVLQHDALGRRFGRGFDRPAALAAYRKAKALDPADGVARADLAILLEHDARGERYGAGADLAAAIDEYRALRADVHDESMDNNLLMALLYAGRFAELKELLAQLEGSPERAILSLVATAATDGAEAAVREADRKLGNDSSRLAALSGAAQRLIALRRYPEAAALLDRASRQSPNAAALLATVDVLRKARRHEEIAVSGREPAPAVRRLVLLAAAQPADARKLAALFSADLTRDLAGPDVERGFAAALGEVRRSLRSSEVPLDAVIDLGLAAVRDAVTGDDAVGYRVELAAAGAEAPRRLVAFVVPEGGEYRIAAMANQPETLAREALRRLARGDLRGARQWLDWARGEAAAGKGEDPLGPPPFVTLWSHGAEATAEEARCAAAALLAESAADAGKALPLLLACREATPEGARRTAVDLSLARAYLGLSRWADLYATAERLLVAAPDSDRAFAIAAFALARLGRQDELRRAADRRLASRADDPAALHALAGAAMDGGDFDRAHALLAKLADGGKADATDFNHLAWMALLSGRADDRAIEDAQRAATLTNYKSAPVLHTLASLYAERGRTAEAYRLILQAVAARDDETPLAADWYVFGRLAEQYGLPDAARAYYRRVAPQERETAMSTGRLAQQRLAALGPEPPARRARR
jgi:transglutaminase-like putative cysteine protease